MSLKRRSRYATQVEVSESGATFRPRNSEEIPRPDCQRAGDGGSGRANTYLYSGGTIKDLSALPGCMYSEATALNDPGQITGTCDISGAGEVHGVVLTDGNVKDIGTLAGRQTRPAAINNAGQVVGWSTDSSKANAADPDRDHGFLYSDGTMIDLNTLPEVAAAGWKIQSALGINNAGQIFGRGLLNGRPRYYLLTPVPAS